MKEHASIKVPWDQIKSMKYYIMRHPEWIKVPLTGTHATKKILRNHGVSTVCEEARCPNKGKCFSKSSAAFMILGDRCTRNCSFCAVDSSPPFPIDPHEPEKVADAAMALGLTYVVITSVTRDDMPDGGARQFVKTIEALRHRITSIKIEVLTPDFKGNTEALEMVLKAGPDVYNHNLETVPRLYSSVRPEADYRTSIHVIKTAARLSPEIITKSGIMIGLGERESEVTEVMKDLRSADCNMLTIGQYLQPGKTKMPVVEYINPEVFEMYRIRGLEMGFRAVASSPLTRSSMDASEMFSAY